MSHLIELSSCTFIAHRITHVMVRGVEANRITVHLDTRDTVPVHGVTIEDFSALLREPVLTFPGCIIVARRVVHITESPVGCVIHLDTHSSVRLGNLSVSKATRKLSEALEETSIIL